MKLCPNCNEVFEEKAGFLFCKVHGWHTTNEAGEIIPADEPTAEQIAAYEMQQQQQPAQDQEPVQAAKNTSSEVDLPSIENPEGDGGQTPLAAVESVSINPDNVLILIAAGGVIVAVIAGVIWYRNRKKNKLHV